MVQLSIIFSYNLLLATIIINLWDIHFWFFFFQFITFSMAGGKCMFEDKDYKCEVTLWLCSPRLSIYLIKKKRLSIYYWKSPQWLLQFNVLGQRVIMIGSFMPQNVAHFNIWSNQNYEIHLWNIHFIVFTQNNF